MSRARIGVFGGTFDPIHVGHLAAVAAAQQDLNLERVLLVVANEPWQKTGSRIINDAELRFRMVAAAVKGHPGLEASRIEIDRGGESYTLDTLRELNAQNPDAELVLILGADAAAGLPTWKDSELIASMVEVAVVNRPGVEPLELGARWRVTSVKMPDVDISSTELRERLEDGRSVDFLVPEPALNVLRREGLYPGAWDYRI